VSIFDGLRDYEPLTITAPSRRHPHWRRVWPLYGPALLIALGLGLLAGSCAALIVRELWI